MQDEVLSLSDAAKKSGVQVDLLELWIKKKLIAPAVMADGNTPFFSDDDMQLIKQVKNLNNMGYEIDDLLKISKKIGLPNKGQKRKGSSGNYLTIGELAKQTGLNSRTLKHWEDKGIFLPTTRSAGGYRLYDPQKIETCKLIQDLQLFNYSLEEIKEMAILVIDARNNLDAQSDRKQELHEDYADEISDIDLEIEKISVLDKRIADIDKGIERWKKRLKKKQAVCISRKKAVLKLQKKVSPKIKSSDKKES